MHALCCPWTVLRKSRPRTKSVPKMSVREAEGLVKKIGADFSLVTQKPAKEKSRDIKRLEEELSDLLTAQVEIRIKNKPNATATQNRLVNWRFPSVPSNRSTG